jgi:hypothetical protein
VQVYWRNVTLWNLVNYERLNKVLIVLGMPTPQLGRPES